jgi:DNA-directed RNA polymerase specialized sigma subunit
MAEPTTGGTTSGNPEAVLLERIRAGDKAACAECIEQHAPAVYRVALRLMGDESEAEDVVQETFLSAFRSIDRFEGRAGLSTWLFRIAHNAALMRLRRAEPPFGRSMSPTAAMAGQESRASCSIGAACPNRISPQPRRAPSSSEPCATCRRS